MFDFNKIKNYKNDEEFNKKLKHLGLHYINDFDTGLTLIKYDQTKKNIYDFNNDLVSFSRGLIFDRKTRKVLCLPPGKSLNIIPFSQMVGTENWTKVDIEEFIDGTMINCFCHNEKWILSTRSSIGARSKWFSKKTFKELFDEAKGNLDLEKLNSSFCYTFVLRHPENRIVTNYKTPNICLVQVREIKEDSYEEIPLEQIKVELSQKNIEIDIPKNYSINLPEEINNILKDMSFQEQGLVFKKGNLRSKVRNIEYENAKFLRGNNKNLLYKYIELRQKDLLEDYLKYFPEYKDNFDNYRKSIEKTTMKLFNIYKKSYIFKTINKNNIPFELRPLCYEMHGIYINSNNKWERGNVIHFFNSLEPARIIFVLNYQKNKEFRKKTL
tara:strand:+ start:11 stop:1159 length:1149 start_codon:yes stop_codon:yes gene_type:complete